MSCFNRFDWVEVDKYDYVYVGIKLGIVFWFNYVELCKYNIIVDGVIAVELLLLLSLMLLLSLWEVIRMVITWFYGSDDDVVDNL